MARGPLPGGRGAPGAIGALLGGADVLRLLEAWLVSASTPEARLELADRVSGWAEQTRARALSELGRSGPSSPSSPISPRLAGRGPVYDAEFEER